MRPENFPTCTIKNIKDYREADLSESKTDGAQCKLSKTQKIAVQSICREHGYDVSEFIREALDHWIDIFPYKEKFKRHRRSIRDIISRLA
jgi:hypothetical protein